jgi:choline dehydrogenase
VLDPCGTCRLGKSVDQGVVDEKLKVYGVQGLRVIDASVFPVIPDCRIQNAVYMAAEKGADLIKAEYPALYS